MKEETAIKASKWWSDVLREGAKCDNGDSNPMLALLTPKLQDSNKNSEGVISDFEKLLTTAIFEEGKTSDRIYIRVDYDPCRLLWECAKEAGMEVVKTTFPWKTTMWIQDDTIEVRYGYGAHIQTV